MSLNFIDVSNFIESLTFKLPSKGGKDNEEEEVDNEKTIAGVYLNRHVPKHTVIGICIFDSRSPLTHEDFQFKVTSANSNNNNNNNKMNGNSWRSPLYLDEYLEDNDKNENNDYVNYSNDPNLNKLIRRALLKKINKHNKKQHKYFYIRTSLNLNEKNVKETMYDIEMVATVQEMRRVMQKFKLLLFNDNDDERKTTINNKDKDNIIDLDTQEYGYEQEEQQRDILMSSNGEKSSSSSSEFLYGKLK